jgi:uncharacterized membrane protein
MSIQVGERLLPREGIRDALRPPRWLVAVIAAIAACGAVWVAAAQREAAVLAGWDAGVLAWLIATALIGARAAGRASCSAEERPAEPATRRSLAIVSLAGVLGFVAALVLAGQIGQPQSVLQAFRVALGMAAVVGSALLVRAECRLHFAGLRAERRQAATFPTSTGDTRGTRASPVHESPDFWQFVYYALPVIGLDSGSDPTSVTPEVCRLAILQSIVIYSSVVILVSFGLSLFGPALDSARIVLGG